jgi:transposase
MRFVAVKTIEQQDVLALHRVRERLVAQRTSLVNQTRGLLQGVGPLSATALMAGTSLPGK